MTATSLAVSGELSEMSEEVDAIISNIKENGITIGDTTVPLSDDIALRLTKLKYELSDVSRIFAELTL